MYFSSVHILIVEQYVFYKYSYKHTNLYSRLYEQRSRNRWISRTGSLI